MLTKPLRACAGVFYCLVAEDETRPVSYLLKTWHGCIFSGTPHLKYTFPRGYAKKAKMATFHSMNK